MNARKERKRKPLLTVRKSLGLNTAEMAEVLGITRSQYERLENSGSAPRLDEAVIICEKLNIPMEILFADLLQRAKTRCSSTDSSAGGCPPGFLALKKGDIDSKFAGNPA